MKLKEAHTYLIHTKKISILMKTTIDQRLVDLQAACIYIYLNMLMTSPGANQSLQPQLKNAKIHNCRGFVFIQINYYQSQ